MNEDSLALSDHLQRCPPHELLADRRSKSRGIATGRPGSNIRCSRFDGSRTTFRATGWIYAGRACPGPAMNRIRRKRKPPVVAVNKWASSGACQGRIQQTRKPRRLLTGSGLPASARIFDLTGLKQGTRIFDHSVQQRFPSPLPLLVNIGRVRLMLPAHRQPQAGGTVLRPFLIPNSRCAAGDSEWHPIPICELLLDASRGIEHVQLRISRKKNSKTREIAWNSAASSLILR